ncbi:MAG: excinuclease ABC subunit UvrB [Candidatus Pacebacteria bacterium]|nr:excinuclease ABC subunit UvrB [Candidatus Paceibacterota bacterium]
MNKLPNKFEIKSKLKPAGDQPKAILELVKSLKENKSKNKRLTLLGATGTGKTFTMANVIEKIQKPTLVIAHNKTLAAQLAQEFRTFFPDNAVHYFVSYYDYYQPEAYLPTTDTYIEKDAQINEEIDRLRHASTQSLLTRNDVIIIASVSCIYGLGSPINYEKVNKKLYIGQKISKVDLMKMFIEIHYERTNADLSSGTFRAIGNRIDIMPMSETTMLQIDIENSVISKLIITDPVSMREIKEVEDYFIFPAKHFISDKFAQEKALKTIQSELKIRIKELEKETKNGNNKLLEIERLKRRTQYDLASIKEFGYCSGIENYSRHFSEKMTGEPPDTLIEYFGMNGREFLTMIDESHVTLPQIRAMYNGDQARKQTLVDFGFRLPSAKDNRPLKYDEFEKKVQDVVYVSATPSIYEKENSEKIIQQIIRPTGLIDPKLEIKPIMEKGKYKGQVHDFISEAEKEIKKGNRVLATTLTKKMAESLSEYLKEKKIKSEYLHSGVETLERIEILTRLRKGDFDCLVGVNLLREGLDLPEVTLIGILDADKEGFLRSETSLIQTIGRAARNVDGRVILYADRMTGSMERAIGETERRRKIQIEYNVKNNITPTTISKHIKDITEELKKDHQKSVEFELNIDRKLFAKNPNKLIRLKEKQMSEAVKSLDFETAAILRDEVKILKEKTVKESLEK